MDLGELKRGSQVATDAECPQCSRRTVQTRIEEARFKYGTGDSAVELTAKIPCARVRTAGLSLQIGKRRICAMKLCVAILA